MMVSNLRREAGLSPDLEALARQVQDLSQDIAALVDNALPGTVLYAPQTDGRGRLQHVVRPWQMGHGQIYLPASAAAAVTISNTTDYFECTEPVWSLSDEAHMFVSRENGRLVYVGAAPCVAHIACSVSFTTAANNRTVHLRLGKNATASEEAEVQRRVTTATDVGSTALHWVAPMNTGDFLSVHARNSTAADDITLECANLQVVAMPKVEA